MHSITNPVIRRVRWVMLVVMLFDFTLTLIGQPGDYWHHSTTTNERNQFFRFFLTQGYVPFIIFMLGYVVAAFWFVSRIRSRVAAIGLVSIILGHYYGASTWLDRHWGYGTRSAIIYGIVLAVGLIVVGLPSSAEAKSPTRR